MAPAGLSNAWVRIRLAGWSITGLWLAVQLAFTVADQAIPRPVRMAGLAVSLVGIVLVAVGFERHVAETHKQADQRR